MAGVDMTLAEAQQIDQLNRGVPVQRSVTFSFLCRELRRELVLSPSKDFVEAMCLSKGR
jgi:hypothetical protein